MIIINNLTKIFPNNTIYYPNITINKKNCYLITGPSGAGKSTLCEIIANFLPFEHGHITLNNQDIKNINIFLYIHYLAQAPENNLIGPTTIDELTLWTKYNCQTDKHNNINEILSIFNLQNHINTPIWQLSFGQKKMLAYVPLSLIPRNIWLLDEPFAGIDHYHCNIINQMMINFINNNGTIIATSHQNRGFERLNPIIINL